MAGSNASSARLSHRAQPEASCRRSQPTLAPQPPRFSTRSESTGHGHVRLLAGYGKNGRPSLELVVAEAVGDGVFVICGTPGLVNGCASGDRVRVDESGAFEILERGGNVAAHVYSHVPIGESDLIELRESFEPLQGLVEWPQVPKFVVITVPIAAGFPAIEAAIETWMTRLPEAEWNFGNVYDDEGRPIGWWV
jgi:Domain of unknown function (DUF4265)